MKIGIIGGGQLGMMMADAAHQLGHYVIGLDPNLNCSLHINADEMIHAAYNDAHAIKNLAEMVDVVTYEFENVDADLMDRYVAKIPQKSHALRVSKHRYTEKKFATSLGIETPKYSMYRSKNDIVTPCIIKTCTGGYDGKGQYLIRNKDNVDQLEIDTNIEHIIEEYIGFDFEISVVATRDVKGNVVTFPLTINHHRDGILFTSTTSSNISQNVRDKAIEYTTSIITSLDYVGTLAVEYFVQNDRVIFNEFAPRPHNSGHYTIEGCNVSQFDNHIRAITNTELIVPRLKMPSIMLNLIGVKPHNKSFYTDNRCIIHDYHKQECRVGRKMGHVTCFTTDIKVLNTIMKQQIEDYYE